MDSPECLKLSRPANKPVHRIAIRATVRIRTKPALLAASTAVSQDRTYTITMAGKGMDVVIFARCHAIIAMRFDEQTDLALDTAIAYAKRLDGRIAAIVCR